MMFACYLRPEEALTLTLPDGRPVRFYALAVPGVRLRVGIQAPGDVWIRRERLWPPPGAAKPEGGCFP